jgi:hypothetical protein
MFLTPEQIEALTGKQRRDAQVRALRHMGIEHRVRADGSVVVLETHVNKLLGGEIEKAVRVKRSEPNWSGVC